MEGSDARRKSFSLQPFTSSRPAPPPSHFLPAPPLPRRFQDPSSSLHLIGGIPVGARFRQPRPPEESYQKILAEGGGPACHALLLPGKLTNADLQAHAALMSSLTRGALRAHESSRGVARLTDRVGLGAQPGPVACEFAERILPDSELLLRQHPLPAVVAHKPFDVKTHAPVPWERLVEIDKLIQPACIVIRDAVKRSGVPLRVSASSSVADVAHELKRHRNLSDVSPAVDALMEAHAAGQGARMHTSSILGLREETSSFGRFFTLPAVLYRIAEIVVRAHTMTPKPTRCGRMFTTVRSLFVHPSRSNLSTLTMSTSTSAVAPTNLGSCLG
jgi:hypothetical protein